jgi:hypothetical protein
VQYPHEGIALPTTFGDYGLCKSEGFASHTFPWWLWFSKSKQDHNKCKMKKGNLLQKVINEACSNVKNCKIIMIPSLKLENFVN